jgi:ubiquinone/menaquinone biosynthesis C-methylase UbiE
MSSVTKDLKSSYDLQYENADLKWRELGARQKEKNIIALAKDISLNKVLEVGAGDGSILNFLDKHDFANELYALEISQSGVEQIKKKQITTLKQVQIFDGYTIPYEDNYFDLVILSHVLEHVEFERALLREIKRVSRHQIIEVPRDYKRGADTKVKHFMSYGHINIYTPTSLKFLLRTEGFIILKEKLAVYGYETFRYIAKGSLKKEFIYTVTWLFKTIALKLPIAREHYCNTITVLCCPDKNAAKIL